MKLARTSLTQDVAPYTEVGDNPARVLRTLAEQNT